MPSVLIAGGGLVGSANACLFARKGWNVRVFESRPDPRGKEPEPGKSINLALGHRAMAALESIGLKEAVLEVGVPLRDGRLSWGGAGDGPLDKLPVLNEGDFILSVSRQKLNDILIAETEKYPTVKYHFGWKSVRIDLDSQTLIVKSPNGEISLDADLILACDGAHSSIRRSLLKLPKFNFQQQYIDYGYMDLSTKSSSGSGLELGVHNTWIGHGFVAVAIVNRDGSLTVSLFAKFSDFESNLSDSKSCVHFFKRNFPRLLAILGEKHVSGAFALQKPQAIISVRCSQHTFFDKLVLMGDAVHAMVPFSGQGVNCGLEDCLVLQEMIEQNESLVDSVREYSRIRTEDANAMNEMAWKAHVELEKFIQQGQQRLIQLSKIILRVVPTFTQFSRTMADKINMSLDDIIKLKGSQKKKEESREQKPGTSNKNAGNKGRAGAKGVRLGAGRRGPPAKNARVALANKVLKKSKAIALRAGAQRAAQRRVIGGARRPVASAGLSTVATKKLVTKLVKNALRKRTNITTAQVIRKRGGVAASTLAARRNLATRRNIAAARAAQPVRTIVQRPTVVRAAPVRTIVQHVQPVPVRVVREVITAPHADNRVIRRGPPPQSRRNRQQQQRTVVVQQVQQPGRRFRQSQANNNRPTVIRRQVVQPMRAPPVRPQYQQVVQRVRQVAQPPQQFQRQHQGQRNVRYVNANRPAPQRRTVVQQVQRYQPVQYVTERVVTSRGRGFRAY